MGIDNKRSDLEKTPGEVDDCSDAKRPREGDSNHNVAMKMEMDDEEEDMTPYHPFGFYCRNWIDIYGHKGAKFDDPSMYSIFFCCYSREVGGGRRLRCVG
jgi:hypothetical protein